MRAVPERSDPPGGQLATHPEEKPVHNDDARGCY